MWFCYALLLKSLFQSLLNQHELALTFTPDGKSYPHCHPFLLLSNYRFLSVTFSLFLWALNCLRGSLFCSQTLCTHSQTHAHTNIHPLVLLQSAWGYSAWHVSVIYYWSDPAASIRLQIFGYTIVFLSVTNTSGRGMSVYAWFYMEACCHR